MPNITTNHAITYTNFRRNLYFYECENFSNSYLNHTLNPKILGFLFYEKQHYLGSEMRKINLQKILGNLLDKFRKLYMNGTVI